MSECIGLPYHMAALQNFKKIPTREWGFLGESYSIDLFVYRLPMLFRQWREYNFLFLCFERLPWQ